MESVCERHPNGNCKEENPVVVRSSMDESMVNKCLFLVHCAYKEYEDIEERCTAMKKHLDCKFGKNWHVVVGPFFGA
ncbi:unnamed protein product [Schistocephalus solidus]|uniref:Dynein light chain n=1 Tax=Schistocephalus solidus TaxID=70667 RepID=A0A183TQV0_SCHSO|nr:unnamed protein product [Schistocephalus solidus]